jgi:threonine-phosphate decarboxylase
MTQPTQIFVPAHGGQLSQIAARFGFRPEQLIDFSANINPAGPPESVLVALQQALADPVSLVAYPDLKLSKLKMALAKASEILPENLAVANGFVPLLEAALRSLKIARCLLPVPSFSEYRQTLTNTGIAVAPYYLEKKEGFFYDPDNLLRAVLEDDCDALLLANPQNPSGALCGVDTMQQLIKRSAKHRVKVLLDEAFIDYVPIQSLTRSAIDSENLVVFRSVTKFFAIPGLRVAYAVSNSSSIQNLNNRLAPWPVSSMASEAVCVALQDNTYAEKTRRENHLRRAWLEGELARLKVITYPSSTNFLLLRFASDVDVHLLWEEMIAEEQIVLRSCANFEGLAPMHLRIAVRSEAENERLVHGLERVLARRKR